MVFATRRRKRVLTKPDREQLFKFIAGYLKNKNCFLFIINGVEDHIHILFELHPTKALSDIMRDLKRGSAEFIKKEGLFPGFNGWAEGYGAFTARYDRDRKTITRYIERQEEHHARTHSKTELLKLLDEYEVEYDEKYLE